MSLQIRTRILSLLTNYKSQSLKIIFFSSTNEKILIDKKKKKKENDKPVEPEAGNLRRNVLFIRDTRHVSTIVPTRFVKVNCTLHVKWPGENPMKGIPTPLCQIAFPSALSNARVWVKGQQLCWPCTTLRRAKPGAEIRNDSGFGHNGWDTLFSLGGRRRNKRGGM